MFCVLCERFWCCVLFTILVSQYGCQGQDRKGFGDTNQDWGYVTVRPDAHMFWWLYYTTASVNYTERPLIIWLQGGPGMPSSGYGNFLEIGPLDVFLNPREHSSVKNFNLLFLDNPVGVGFSYFSANNTNYAASTEEIGKDLVRFMEEFLNEKPEFQTVPVYLFGESYGGKMAVEFAYQLNLRIRKEKIKCNLKGIGLGDAYISPKHYTMNYAPMVYHLGLIDSNLYQKASARAEVFKQHCESASYDQAYEIDGELSRMLERAMTGVDWYNIAEPARHGKPSSLWKYHEELTKLMNERVKSVLKIPDDVHWAFLSGDNYESLLDEFLKPITGKVETLLNSTDIKVVVYNGVLDLIVSTAGTVAWVNELSWKQSSEWSNATQAWFEVNGIVQGFEKEVGNLVLYTILRAGHSVPIDNPAAMEYITGKFLEN